MAGITPQTVNIYDNYQRLLESIGRASIKAGRNQKSIRLVVVTKSQSVQAIAEVLQAGAADLGENYVEEALQKMLVIEKMGIPGNLTKITWHMIGHVQSRKAESVVTHFQYMHSLDSRKLADRMNRFSQELEKRMPVLLEFNTSGESTKSGWPVWEEDSWNKLLPELKAITELSHIRVLGLMTMAPYMEDSQRSRPYYRRLRKLQDYLRKNIHSVTWDELSMGMSGDFEIAIEEGATWIRIGQAIFGPRQG